MKHYILVHGAWHGSWCWKEVVQRLTQRGHQVSTPDLPSRIDCDAPISLRTYVRAVADLVEQQLNEDKRKQKHTEIVLVGHSMAGVIISQVAQHYAPNVVSLCFIAAYILADKESIIDYAKADSESLIYPNIQKRSNGDLYLETEIARLAFYGDCETEKVDKCLKNLNDQAPLPLVNKIKLNHEKFVRLKKVYIQTLYDKSVSFSLQNRMLNNWQGIQRHVLDCGHSPFISMPEKLTELVCL